MPSAEGVDWQCHAPATDGSFTASIAIRCLNRTSIMPGTVHPRVKICCISSGQEAQMAIQAGAVALGLVGDMPSGPGIITDKEVNLSHFRECLVPHI